MPSSLHPFLLASNSMVLTLGKFIVAECLKLELVSFAPNQKLLHKWRR